MSEENTVDTPSQEATQLTLTDLVAMKSIIDIASQRGTFKPTEMVVVGQTYSKLIAFLESVKQQNQGETK
jgi:hypothetical protein